LFSLPFADFIERAKAGIAEGYLEKSD